MDSRESSAAPSTVLSSAGTPYIQRMARASDVMSILATHVRILRENIPPRDAKIKDLEAKLTRMNQEYERVVNGPLPANAEPGETKPAWIIRRVNDMNDLVSRLHECRNSEGLEDQELEFEKWAKQEEKEYFISLLQVFPLGREWAAELYGRYGPDVPVDIATPESMDDQPPIPSAVSDGGGDVRGGVEWDVPDDAEEQPPLEHRPNTHLADLASARKRRISKSAGTPKQIKRPRHDSDQQPLAKTGTIEFDKVFEKGEAQTKHEIVRFRDEWYIIQGCREHRIHFAKNPIRAAARHLGSYKHDNMGSTSESAVKALGLRVLNCNKALAAKNNKVALEAFGKRRGKPTGYRLSNEPASKCKGRKTAIPKRNPIDVMEINPEDICAAKWPKHKGYYPVYVLPPGECRRLRYLESSILQTSLYKELPSCYVYDGKGIPRWAPGYEDGGPLVAQRQYPVLFFMDGRFPNETEISWISGASMRPYDKNNKEIRYREHVEDFLLRRHKPTMSPEPARAISANSDRRETPSSNAAVPGNAASPRLSPYAEVHRILERASRDPGQDDQHEGDRIDDRERERRFEDGCTEEEPAPSDEGEEEEEEEERQLDWMHARMESMQATVEGISMDDSPGPRSRQQTIRPTIEDAESVRSNTPARPQPRHAGSQRMSAAVDTNSPRQPPRPTGSHGISPPREQRMPSTLPEQEDSYSASPIPQPPPRPASISHRHAARNTSSAAPSTHPQDQIQFPYNQRWSRETTTTTAATAASNGRTFMDDTLDSGFLDPTPGMG